MATRKITVPDISNLLGEISKKRDSGELPKTERQHIQPVPLIEEGKSSSSLEVKQENSKTPIMEKSGTKKQVSEDARWPGGRPSVKRDDIEYVKISPKIPAALKEEVDVARSRGRFKDENGKPIKTLDELVALALDRLLKS